MGAEVGALLAVGGLITQISAQGQAQDAQRSQLESNARGARESARLARLEGIENAKLQQIQADKIIAGIRPQFSASGVEEEGSVFDVISNSFRDGFLITCHTLFDFSANDFTDSISLLIL